MTTSLPSREIHTIEIPEIIDFAAKFHYNFFVPDESVNDSGGIPENILLRQAGEIDANFVQFSLTRAPRFVSFQFTPPRITNSGRQVTEQEIRDNTNSQTTKESYIQQNLDKIVSEDQFSSNAFVSVNFHDGELNDKIYDLVSGSIEQMTSEQVVDREINQYRAAQKLSTRLSKNVSTQFLQDSVSSLEKSAGTTFYSKSDSNKARNISPSDAVTKTIKNQVVKPARNQSVRLTNVDFIKMNSVKEHVQINSKLFADFVNKQMMDPNSPHADSLHSIQLYAKKIQDSSRKNLSSLPTDEDYKSLIPFVDVQIQNTAHMSSAGATRIVGFMIDKLELTADGSVIQHDSIIIENSSVTTSADYKVKYGSQYKYEIRTIVEFTLPAIDDDTNQIATIKSLVSSRPSNSVYVDCRETEAPPPPNDLNFSWNYETDKLLIHWNFPTNSQRDIKKFQVFRRRSIDDAFELMKMYDFDDSVKRYSDNERPDPSVVELVKSPTLFWVDDEFDKNIQNQSFIYAVTCIDAHGFTSNYSAQFEIGFDIFKNKLTKRLISHSGAPKQYPNLYLERDAFIDTIKVSGPWSKKLKIYFNPEFYYISDNSDRHESIITTKQDGGNYKLQVINLDNQKSQQITISIDDQRMVSNKSVENSKYDFGVKTRLSKR